MGEQWGEINSTKATCDGVARDDVALRGRARLDGQGGARRRVAVSVGWGGRGEQLRRAEPLVGMKSALVLTHCHQSRDTPLRQVPG